MGSDLRFVMPLLRILNQADELRMNYRTLCSKLGVSVQELQDTAMSVNDFDSLLVQEGEDLVLLHPLDLLDDKTIFEKVSMRGRFAMQEISTSTNSELMEERDNLVSGDALVAEIQTQGRTRRDGQWYTGIGTNVIASMAFKFESLPQLLGFSLAVGVATVTALENLGFNNIKLKWPNDVVFQDRKLAGILIESVPTSDGGIFAIVGTGINVHHYEALKSPLLERPAICLDDLGIKVTRNDVCINLINETKYAASRFKKTGLDGFIEIWHRHDALYGRQVEVAISSHRTVNGRVAGVNKLGELILESNSGRTAIRSGHIVRVY